ARSCTSPARLSRSSRSRHKARTSSRASPGISAIATPRCNWWATGCGFAATTCWKRCCAGSARGSLRSRRRSSRSTVRMDMDTAKIMAIKRPRRRTERRTRGRRVVREGAPPPTQLLLDSQLRGNEREEGGFAKRKAVAVGDLNAADLYRLMAWLSPSYPIGAFSYSSGIEWVVEAGDITDAATLERWLGVMISDGSGFCDAVFFSPAHRAVAKSDDGALRAVAELAAAFAASRERHLETTAQGRAFLDTTRAAWPTAVIDRLLRVYDGAVALPVAVAVASAGHGIALAPAL